MTQLPPEMPEKNNEILDFLRTGVRDPCLQVRKEVCSCFREIIQSMPLWYEHKIFSLAKIACGDADSSVRSCAFQHMVNVVNKSRQLQHHGDEILKVFKKTATHTDVSIGHDGP